MKDKTKGWDIGHAWRVLANYLKIKEALTRLFSSFSVIVLLTYLDRRSEKNKKLDTENSSPLGLFSSTGLLWQITEPQKLTTPLVTFFCSTSQAGTNKRWFSECYRTIELIFPCLTRTVRECIFKFNHSCGLAPLWVTFEWTYYIKRHFD